MPAFDIKKIKQEQVALFSQIQRLTNQMGRFRKNNNGYTRNDVQKNILISEAERINNIFEGMVARFPETSGDNPDIGVIYELARIYYNWADHCKQLAWFHYYFKVSDTSAIQNTIYANDQAINNIKIAFDLYDKINFLTKNKDTSTTAIATSQRDADDTLNVLNQYKHDGEILLAEQKEATTRKRSSNMVEPGDTYHQYMHTQNKTHRVGSAFRPVVRGDGSSGRQIPQGDNAPKTLSEVCKKQWGSTLVVNTEEDCNDDSKPNSASTSALSHTPCSSGGNSSTDSLTPKYNSPFAMMKYNKRQYRLFSPHGEKKSEKTDVVANTSPVSNH
jgi:hypothetical protein